MDSIDWNEELEDSQISGARENLIAIVKKSYDLQQQMHLKSDNDETHLRVWAEYTVNNMGELGQYCLNDISHIDLVKICWFLCWHVILGRNYKHLYEEEKELWEDYLTVTHPEEKMVEVDREWLKGDLKKQLQNKESNADG